MAKPPTLGVENPFAELGREPECFGVVKASFSFAFVRSGVTDWNSTLSILLAALSFSFNAK